MTAKRKTSTQLADEHWKWIESVLTVQMKLTEKLFKEGMIHGYKHGRESKQ